MNYHLRNFALVMSTQDFFFRKIVGTQGHRYYYLKTDLCLPVNLGLINKNNKGNEELETTIFSGPVYCDDSTHLFPHSSGGSRKYSFPRAG